MATWVVHGVLKRIVDGDTVIADLDLGWKIWLRDVSIRLEGINAYELNTPQGKEAREKLRIHEGKGIEVVSHSVDKYGRVLGSVTTSENVNLGLEVLALGLAVPYNP